MWTIYSGEREFVRTGRCPDLVRQARQKAAGARGGNNQSRESLGGSLEGQKEVERSGNLLDGWDCCGLEDCWVRVDGRDVDCRESSWVLGGILVRSKVVGTGKMCQISF